MTDYSDKSDTYVPRQYQERNECCNHDDCDECFFMKLRKEFHFLRNHR